MSFECSSAVAQSNFSGLRVADRGSRDTESTSSQISVGPRQDHQRRTDSVIHLSFDLPLKTKISHFRDDLSSQSVKILQKKLNLTQQTDMHRQTKK